VRSGSVMAVQRDFSSRYVLMYLRWGCHDGARGVGGEGQQAGERVSRRSQRGGRRGPAGRGERERESCREPPVHAGGRRGRPGARAGTSTARPSPAPEPPPLPVALPPCGGWVAAVAVVRPWVRSRRLGGRRRRLVTVAAARAGDGAVRLEVHAHHLAEARRVVVAHLQGEGGHTTVRVSGHTT